MENKKEKRTSEILEELRSSCVKGNRVSVGDFVTKLSDRSYGLAIFIFGLITGIVPGVSVIFSVPIVIIAIQMILNQKQIWIPKFLSEKTFSESVLRKALGKTIPVLRFIERFIRPRMNILTSDVAEKFIALILIMLAFIVFLPLPGFNFFPAMCMCVLAIGILEKDGLLIFLGSFISLGSIYFMGFLIIKATHKFIDYIHHSIIS